MADVETDDDYADEPSQAEREAICAERGHYVLRPLRICLRCLKHVIGGGAR